MVHLSICIPTYNRPDLLARALASVTRDASPAVSNVEIVVSDNSAGTDSEIVARRAAEGWPGRLRYHRNEPSVGMVGNFNRCIELANGQWVHILHDDDYLLPGGLANMLVGTKRARHEDRVLLFGVRVVDGDNRLQRSHTFRRDRSLDAGQGLRRLLSRSSFVRFPGIVVHSGAYARVGPFDPSVGGITDVDMWVRLFSAFGVRLVALTTCAWVLHAEADSHRVFTPEAVATLTRIFDRAAAQGVLSERTVRRCQAHYLHQFVLAGAFRQLRAGDRGGARDVLRLFRLPEVRTLGASARWAPVRVAFAALSAGPRIQV